MNARSSLPPCELPLSSSASYAATETDWLLRGQRDDKNPGSPPRVLGINLGAETLKVVELSQQGETWTWTRRACVEHHKNPGAVLVQMLGDWPWEQARSVAASGRLARQLNVQQVPAKQAQVLGSRYLLGPEEKTVVSLGSHGFSVLELRGEGLEVFRENSRCSQGTGNFLRQLVERFSLGIEEASRLCSAVENPAVLSGRCPVILKTDMTHLANKGEDKARILAGLFDAVCENVLVLLKPGLCPRKVFLIGGVARAPRVQATFKRRLEDMGLELGALDPELGLYAEALGSALVAAQNRQPPPPLQELLRPLTPARLEKVPSLAEARQRVRRIPDPGLSPCSKTEPLVLGFDIGSTGSKAVALTAAGGDVVWESYRSTHGDPVGAAQALLLSFLSSALGQAPVIAFGVTGSGREIVGSLLTACYGRESVFILNEIAAHAEGALHFDARVDTIFEIGGQDAKYIRLAEGRVVDCAMNEACSAGTGSFIEEQGRKFPGIADVRQLGSAALAAPEGVSLGQHCSVFMAEVIDEAVAAGVESGSIIAGLYDSIIRNYLNRVKGSRSVGSVIFCQGMPFASDALAAAVTRQTGSEVVIPPNPGTVGALGIALLTRRAGLPASLPGVELKRFLEARVESKDSFQCKAHVGCGGAGNLCRIERLNTIVAGRSLRFTWGGACALHDKATRRRKLPDLAPDPFREREEMLQRLLAPLTERQGTPVVALTDEFTLKGLLPFFAAFLFELGFSPRPLRGGTQEDLKRGIQGANVPFCAPLQLYHGVVERLAGVEADYLFLPMLRSLPRQAGEAHAVTCPILQASPDILGWDLGAKISACILRPIINIGAESLASPEFLRSCRELAQSLGRRAWKDAYHKAVRVQESFDRGCLDLGRRALDFCEAKSLVPVVVLGRPYTIYNGVLNSNVPAILREQGAIGIPVDCYPLSEGTPVFEDMYWGQGQRILRAAHDVRRAKGHYSLYCSNYACGPDSFNLHFYSHIMEGKPFAIIETDGHSGDAGTKTRVEAFLHCVEQDRRRTASDTPAADFSDIQTQTLGMPEILAKRERLLIPWMGRASEVFAAQLRGLGIPAESLPQPGPRELKLGRRHTSGKECLPMALTLGSLLARLERAQPEDRFAYLLSSTCGPCRFGVYNLLNQIVLRRRGLEDQVRIWSPKDTGYFADLPPGFAMLLFAGFLASDLLLEARDDVIVSELRAGATERLHQQLMAELMELVRNQAPVTKSLAQSLWQVSGGELFGISAFLRRAGRRFASLRGTCPRPTVMVVGEIYVRLVPFANDDVVAKLQERGIRARLAPLHEWFDYSDRMSLRHASLFAFKQRLSTLLQSRIQRLGIEAIAGEMAWPEAPDMKDTLATASTYLNTELEGEAVLTLGAPLQAWRRREIDGVVSVGPHECMPNKIAEAQLFHVAEKEGLPSLTLSLNGEGMDCEQLDSFVFEVKSRFHARADSGSGGPADKGGQTKASPGKPLGTAENAVLQVACEGCLGSAAGSPERSRP